MTVEKPRTLEEMAARLKPDRTAFAAVYDRERKEDTPDFKTIAIQRPRSPDETVEQGTRADMLAALKRAEADGWLERFNTETLGELTDDPQLIVDLQAITNPKVDFDHIGDVNTGMLRAMRRCCRIVCGDDDDVARGSGFLVGPQLVLTNWHVVSKQILAEKQVRDAHEGARRALVDQGRQAEADALPPPARLPIKVHVEFDSFRNGDGTLSKPVEERVVDAWLAAESPNSVNAVPGTVLPLPTDLNMLKEYLDFAVLELANPVGYERGWYELNKDLPPPKADAQGVLVQFPSNFAMRVTAGLYTDDEPELPARIRHGMNAIGGSSGGLCATTAYEPLALHQGSLRVAKRLDRVEGKKLDTGIHNVAIPLALIAQAAGERISLRALEAPALVHKTLAGHPIVGRQDLQRAIHESIYGGNRVIVVRNSFNPETGKLENGIGKSFTIQILEAMTRSADTLIRTVGAQNLPADPYVAAKAIAAQFRDAAAGTAIQAFDAVAAAVPQGDTTQDADVRALADTLLSALRAVAGERILWLVIDDLDRHPIDSSSQTSNLLNLLYASFAADPHLRALLIGPTSSLSTLDPIWSRTDGPLRGLEPAEIERWIMLSRGADRPLSSDMVTAFQRMVFAMLPAWRPQELRSKTAKIAEILKEVIGPQLA